MRLYEGSTKWYQVAAPPEQSLFLHSSFVTKEADILRVDKPAYAGRWIDVDLTNQVMTAYYGAQPLLVAQTASGTNKNPTDKGTYPTFWRLASQRMQGDNLFAADYYNLDAVPYISYFHPEWRGDPRRVLARQLRYATLTRLREHLAPCRPMGAHLGSARHPGGRALRDGELHPRPLSVMRREVTHVECRGGWLERIRVGGGGL